jgi:hypothetical protein
MQKGKGIQMLFSGGGVLPLFVGRMGNVNAAKEKLRSVHAGDRGGVQDGVVGRREVLPDRWGGVEA